MSTTGSSSGLKGKGKDYDVASTPSTIEELAQALAALKLEQDGLKEKVDTIEEEDTGVKESQRKLVKLPTPPRFKGTSPALDSWIIQLRNYVTYNTVRFEDEESKTIFAGALLDGVAAKWFEPHAKRHYEYGALKSDKKESLEAKQSQFWARHTVSCAMFTDFENFIRAITTEFGELDAERRAEQKLILLRQKTSVTEYATEFRVEAANTHLGEEALVMLFWQGLKKHVTDELYRLDRPKKLQEMVELAIRADNRYFDYQRELSRTKEPFPHREKPKRQNNFTEKVRGFGRQVTPSTSFGHHAGPMDIGMVGKNQPRHGQRQEKHPKSKARCFNCNNLGHYARECRQGRKQVNFAPLPEGKTVRSTHKEGLVIRMVNSEDNDWMNDFSDNDNGPYLDDSDEYEGAQEESSRLHQEVQELAGCFGRLALRSGEEAEPSREAQVAEDRLPEVLYEPSRTQQEVQVAEDRLLAEGPARDETPEVQIDADRLRTRLSIPLGSGEIVGSHHQTQTAMEPGVFPQPLLTARARYVESMFYNRLPAHVQERFERARWNAENQVVSRGSMGNFPRRWMTSMTTLRVGTFRLPVHQYLGNPVSDDEPERLYRQALSEIATLQDSPMPQHVQGITQRGLLLNALRRFANTQEHDQRTRGIYHEPSSVYELKDWEEIQEGCRSPPDAWDREPILDKRQSTYGAVLDTEEHSSLLWISCVHDNCGLSHHLGLKIYFGHFPTKDDGAAVACVYRHTDPENYKVTITSEQVRIVNKVPRRCAEHPDEPWLGLHECPHSGCSLHKNQKAEDWHWARHKESERFDGYNPLSRRQRILDLEFQDLRYIEPFSVSWTLRSDTQGLTSNILRLHDQHPRIRLGNGSGPSPRAENQ